MRHLRSSLRSALTPILVGAQAIVLISCEPAQPLLVQRPTFSPSSEASLDVYDNGTRSIKLSVPDSSLTVGQSVQATAIPYNGNDLAGSPTGTAVAYAVAPSGIVSVSSTGLIKGLAAGTATVSASSGTFTQNMTITVSGSGTLASQLTLSVNPTSIKIGQTAQVSGLVGYSSPPTSPSQIVFTSQQPSIGSISSSGLVKGLAVGTVTVLAQVDTVKRTISISVLDSATTTTPVSSPTAPVPGGATGGSYGSATAAELPRASVNTSYPSMSRQVRVPAGANLQSAINAAQPGDELLLAPGATYAGNFTLPDKGSSTSWIVIRSDLSDAVIGAPGTRMTPSRAASANLAKIISPNIYGAITTNLTAHHYRFTGVEIGAAPSSGDINALARFGDASSAQNSTANIAHDFVIDRAYVHVSPTSQVRRCIMVNSASTAIIDSWLSECHSNNGDSQAIAGWNGPGPYLFQNNHLEAGHEVIMFGGSNVTIANLSPSDVTIRGNHITRPASWKGVWQVKNLIETKHVRRMLVEGNVIENTWASGQTGYAFVMKSENQAGDAPWSQSTDITIRFNKIRNIGAGFNIAANPGGYAAVPAARFVITDNTIENLNSGTFNGDGRPFLLQGGLADFVAMHNTIVTSSNAAFYLTGSPVEQRLVVHSNVLHYGAFGVKGDGTAIGTGTLNAYAPGALFTNNAFFLGGSAYSFPANNFFAATTSDIGFQNFAGGDYTLSSSSAYRGKGYDGRDIGANISQLNSQTSGAVVAP
jgi:hypothetical protein